MDEDKVIPVKVALRIRPLVPKEVREGCQLALETVEKEPQVHILNSKKCFTYDFAYDGEVEQDYVYQDCCKPILSNLYKGFNVTVLAYGQTGSGKTHTMGTAYKSSEDPDTEGVIPRAVRDIFDHISRETDTEFIVKVSFIELYNEQLFDLLSHRSRTDAQVELREDTTGIKIPGLTELPVTSVGETMRLLERASEGRITASTAMNLQSSRSHAIFTLTLEAKPRNCSVMVSKFHMVDLAGSERQKKTKAKGERLKEGININMGLLSLGNVISALGEENKSSNHHIPYRDSKLTRLLQDSLGGNSHTLMIACVSPADSNVEETISTLRYADRARKIKNKPIINKDPRSAELGRLREQVQKLQLQLLQSDRVCNAVGETGEMELLKSSLKRYEDENCKLTTALQSAMDEHAHMSEKLLLSEKAQETLKNRLQELSAQAEETVKDMENLPIDVRQKMDRLREKVESVRDHQKQAEKTLLEHDISRFNPRDNSMNGSRPSSPSQEDENSPDSDKDAGQDFGGATYALRQSELTNQLQELNKVLLAKQELAQQIGVNDEKLIAMKVKYEETVKHLEEEIDKLQTEKDQLHQQQRNAGSGAASLTGGSNKVSEQRRKRIQELETQIQDLKKKQTEQQRLAKLNQQNELKVKKLAEEIQNMKVMKVKLIKQMREESEKVRQWKLGKEKEVHQLKQKDRKAQVQLAKMERLHERQKNVLRRKMEETVAVNKRLKDALEKKAQARAQKGGKEVLAGSGERVRGWISSELDVVVSAKEAEKSKEQLLRDRKEITSELAKMKAEARMTMGQDDRSLMEKKLQQLQQDLDMRNAQLSDLQQQILSFNEDKEKDKSGDRWSRLASMVEAKIAAQYLFDTASEMMAAASLRGAEVKDLRHQCEELVDIRDSLKSEIHKIRIDHEDEMVRMEREHEEKVLFLLRQLPGCQDGDSKSPEVSLGKDISAVEERLKFQAAELAKMSVLHDALLQRDQEVANLREELSSAGRGDRGRSLMPKFSTPPSKKQAANSKKRVTIAVERYKEDELDELFSNSSESSEEEDEDEDPEWVKTPMFRRLKQERQSLGALSKRKRRSSAFTDAEEKPDMSDSYETKKKRSSTGGCNCKQGCKNKRCSCKKSGPFCSHLCNCIASKCANREIPGEDVSDASCMSTTDIENRSSDEENAVETTDKLLDSTFELPAKPLAATPNSFFRSPLKALNPRNRDSADMFSMDSDVEATPTNKKQNLQDIEATPTNRLSTVGEETGSFFVSPQLK